MSEILENRQNLYDNLIADGYFRGDDGEVNFSFEDFCEGLNDQENARNFFNNMVDDGYFRDDNGELSLSEDDFLAMIGSVRPKQDFYPITENQRGVFIDWEMNSDRTQYNVPDVIRFDGISPQTLRDAVVKVIEAHPYLKTHFAKMDDDVVQLRLDEAPVTVTIEQLSTEPDSAFFQQRVKPFNLLEGPLYRAEVYGTPSTTYLFLDIHHTIFDGGSSIVFSNELKKVLAGEEPQGEEYTAFDRALDESDFWNSDACHEAELYFEKKLTGIDTTVYPRSNKNTGEAVREMIITDIPGKAIEDYCHQNGVTESNYFLTMLMQILHRVTREEDVLITTIHHGRTDLRMMETMGMFVKTQPVVSNTPKEQVAKTEVKTAIQAIQSQMLETQKYDIYSFTKMVERYGIRAEIMYVYQGGGMRTPEDDEKDHISLDLNTAKLPLSLIVIPTGMEDYQLRLEYDASLYSEADMKTLNGMIAAACLSAPKAKTLADIMLLTADEQKALVDYSKGKDLDVDITKTFAQAFEERARLVPDNVAVADRDSHLTYRQLSHYSDVLAHQLVDADVQPNDFVCVMLDRFKEFPLSVLAIHKAGAAYTPMDFEYPNERLQYMLENSESKVLITSHTVLEAKKKEGAFETGNVQIIFIEDVDFSVAVDSINLTTPDNLAYMIYTSGSTGKPKGAMLHQAGLWNFINIVIDMEHLTADDRIEGHRSFSFDAHIEDMYPILTLGGSFHIMPTEIRKDVGAIRDFLFEHQITGGGYSTAIAALLLNTYNDLPVRFITAGGEKLDGVYSDHVEIINVYGPTECTDDTSYYSIARGTHVENIPIGKPVANSWNFIVDETGHLVPPGVVGELCIAGILVGRGYWRLPERTAQSFVDCPFVSEDRWGRKVRMYHTGDLCRWNEDGDLEYMGRIDFQVKLRGFRIELGEIESKVLQIEGVLQAAAEVRKVMGTEHLVLYYTVADGSSQSEASQGPSVAIDEKTIRKALEESALADYMVPDTYMLMDVMPMTPNGKVNRKALPAPEIKAAEIVPAANDTEQQLLDIAIELLKHDKFGVTTNLISMGLTSLLAMRMSAMIQKKLNMSILTKQIFAHPTIRELALLGEQTENEDPSLFTQHASLPYYPITENQRGVYIDWELNRNTTQYNLPSVVKIAGTDAKKLRDALVQVVDAHPYLKTRLSMKGDDVVQLRLDDEPAVVELTELNEEPTTAFFRSRVRPFDLFRDRLYRMEVYQTPAAVYYFQDIHHIIFDGGSDFVLRSELDKALHGEALQPETYSAFDRALDEQALQQSEQYREAERYFDRLLEDVEMITYPHSDQPDGAEVANNAYVEVEINKSKVDDYSRERSVTPNNFLLTALMQVLHRLTREERIAITTISNGRSDTRMHTIMGMFVKTLPVVSRLDKNLTFTDALLQMNQQSFQSQGNDIYPFTKIAERYRFRSEIMFVFQGGMGTPVVTPADDSISLDLDTVKMPIAMMVTETADDKYNIQIEYDTHLYSHADITLLANALKTFALQVLNGVDNLSDISLVDQEQLTSILQLSKGEDLAYDKRQTFVDMVCSHAATNPDAIAVVDRSSKITYRQLDEQSNALAAKLIDDGVKPDTFVGIMLSRQKEFIVALLAIMKAGAAYIPMDHEYPIDRLLYMLEDSQCQLLITSHAIMDEKNSSGDTFEAKNTLFIDDFLNSVPVDFADRVRVNLSTPDGLAYMIYTSGSTGRPKGVMLPHRALRAYLAWRIAKIGITPESRHLEHASFSFDASLDDLLCPLAAGGCLYILPEELRKDMDGIYQYIKDHRITGLTLSTALGMTMLNQYSDLPVKYIMMGGEKMLPFPKTPIKVINGYGPTEFSVCSSYHVVDQDKDVNIPIGRPVPNSSSFICDTFGQLLPVGAPGELCLSGIQMSKGYWLRDELTQEKFCDAPFGYKVYHTGDLARWNEQGELEFMGRIDNQVKLRGFRIELGEIENQASLIEGIKAVAAEVREAGGSKHLVLYFTATSEMDTEEIRERLSASLTEYMVPDTYMQLNEMPLTPNGKVNRRALPAPVIRSAAEYVEPATETERIIAQAMQEVLALEQPIGALDSFFAWGGDSIKSIRLVSKLRSAGITLQVADIMKLKTVRNIAAASMETVISVDQSAWSGEVPQSAITRFFFDLSLPLPHHFNQTMFIKVNQRLHVKAMEDTIKALTEHHDMLRAIVRNSMLYVRNADEPNLYGWEELDYSKDEAYVAHIEEICRHRQSHINLSNGPLLKVTLFHTPDYDALLMVCHHIIVDGVSWRVLLDDLNTAYTQASNGQPIVLPEKTHSYKTYAETLQRYASSYELEQEIPYWNAVQEKLMELPNSNAKDFSRKFSMINAVLDSATTHAITTNAGEVYSADINDLLMTALGRSYYQLTGKAAVSVQFEGHGREYIGDDNLLTDRTVGWFTSVYPIVLEHLDGDLRSCLRQSKETMHRVPNKGVGYNILRFFNGDVHYDTNRCALIGFNYLGEMDSQGSTAEAAFAAMTEISSGDDFAPQNLFGPDVSINCSVMNGELAANLAYNHLMYTEEQAQKLLNGMMSALKEIVAHTSTIDTQEVTATDLGEYEWSDADFQKIYNSFVAKGTPLQRIYPLSPMQEGIMLKFMLEPDSLAYRLVSRMALDVVPTEEQLRYALDQLAAKHEVLRTSIIYRDTELYRQAIVDRKLELEMRDITTAADKETTMVAMYKAEQQRGFDMEYDPLFRIICVKTSETTSEILLAVHHIIVDGWCIGLFMNDLILNLTDALQGNMRPIEHVQSGRYEKFVRELTKKNKQKGLDYWKKLLEGYAMKAVIPSTGIVPERERAVDNVCSLKMSEDEMQALNALSASLQVTMNTIVELAWGFVLQAYNRQNDVLFVKVVSGRNNASESVEDVVGLFINSVPVRVTLQKGTTISQALQSLQQQAAETNEWDYCPLSVIQQQSDLNGELFQSIVAFENYESNHQDENPDAPFHVKMIYSKEESINDITVTAYVSNDSLEVNVEFDNRLYRRPEIEQVAVAMKHMLKTIARHPDVDVCNIIPLGKKDTLELVQLGKGDTLSFDTSKTLVDLFTEQAQKTPDDTCIVFKDVRLSYREVDQMTDRLAVLLQREYDVQPEMAVGVMIDRSELMLIYPMAIMKAGAAYMPLDFHFPEDRLTFMCKDAGVQLILSEENRVEEAIPGFAGQVIKRDILDRLQSQRSMVLPSRKYKAKPENMFVILYTSGSTGTPKGVVLEHRNIVNFCHWYVKAFDVTAQDRAVAYANFGFDAHMMDIYPVISVGGSVYIIPSEMRMDLMAMNEYMEQEQLNLAFMTTQVGYMFATTIENKSLRLLSVGGEKLQPLAKPAFRFYNGYGPTECTLYSTVYNIEKDYDSSYIGRPLDNYQLFVVDQNLNLVPRGVAGELIVAGAGVGRGYLNRPELNAEKFITYMGQKAYRTGDLVRWSPDGNIDFLGRMDNQVKLRGLRIELGEIEARAAKYPDIKSVAVDVKEVCGAQHICCYFTSSTDIDVDRLKDFLSEKLTDYMVPTAYMQLDKLPLTPNGKVNRRALPTPSIVVQTENVPPQGEKEATLFNIACELLKTDQFGVTDDLTQMGLTSLLGIKLVMMAQKKDIMIKLDDVMKLKNIRSILQHNMSIVSWAHGQSDEKPIVVLVCGATPYKDMAPYIEELSKNYSVLVFEPIVEHYDYIFKDADIEEVVEMYYALLDINVPEDTPIAAFTGHCFGGEIAYRLAIKREQETGLKSPMVMLDVFWRIEPLVFNEEELMRLIPRELVDKYGSGIRSYTKAMHMYDSLGRKGTPPLFNGDVVLFRATETEPDDQAMTEIYAAAPKFKEAWHQVTAERGMDNRAFWTKYYPQMEVYDVAAHHMSMLEKQHVTEYVGWIDEKVKK